MTAPRPRGRAELEHPPWCQQELCSLEALPAGGCHQREFVVVDDDGQSKIASVLLRQYASGRVTIGAGSWSMREWSPRSAELVARQMLEAKALLDAVRRADGYPSSGSSVGGRPRRLGEGL